MRGQTYTFYKCYNSVSIIRLLKRGMPLTGMTKEILDRRIKRDVLLKV
jgi:hypothetical protein